MQDAAGNPLAAATMRLLVEILAGEAGNLALKVMATGGLPVAGWRSRAYLPLLQEGSFMRNFRDKGRLSDVLARVPVHVATAPAALLGAARHGLDCIAGGGC